MKLLLATNVYGWRMTGLLGAALVAAGALLGAAGMWQWLSWR